MMIDLTKIEKPFGLLDAETREALAAHGGPYECYSRKSWVEIQHSTFAEFPHIVYRVATPAPTPDVWPWDAINKRFNYAARDADGNLFLFTIKPEIIRREWLLVYDEEWLLVDDGEYEPAQCLNVTIGTCDWKDSLVVRTGYVEGE